MRTLVISIVLCLSPVGVLAQDSAPSNINEPIEAFETSGEPPVITPPSFSGNPFGNYNPYYGGSYESLNYESFNSNVGPNCGFVVKGETYRDPRIDETVGKASVAWYSNKCKDYEAIELIRQEGQKVRSRATNLDTCLRVRVTNEQACPRDVLDQLLGL